MRRLPKGLALGLMITAAPVPAMACALYHPLEPEDVRRADVVVIGRLSHFRREVSADSLRWFAENRDRSRPSWMPDLGARPPRDLTSFAVTVEQVAKGRAPSRINVVWHMSNISPPERLRDGRYLIGLNHPRPETPIKADFVVFGGMCSGAFIYPAGGQKAVAALRVLAGKPPFPPDPPSPPEPEASASDIPRPAPDPRPPGYPDSEPLLDRVPTVYRVMMGGAGLGLLVAISALFWRRRVEEEADGQ